MLILSFVISFYSLYHSLAHHSLCNSIERLIRIFPPYRSFIYIPRLLLVYLTRCSVITLPSGLTDSEDNPLWIDCVCAVSSIHCLSSFSSTREREETSDHPHSVQRNCEEEKYPAETDRYRRDIWSISSPCAIVVDNPPQSTASESLDIELHPTAILV